MELRQHKVFWEVSRDVVGMHLNGNRERTISLKHIIGNPELFVGWIIQELRIKVELVRL